MHGEEQAAERNPPVQATQATASREHEIPLWREPLEPAPSLPGSVPQEQGRLGTVAPQPARVIHRDAPLHEDEEGRAQHALLDLKGAAGHGFVGVWRDTRDGNAGLYFGRLDRAGEPREPERPLYSHGSSGREMEPAVALSSDGIGGFTWYSSGTADQQVNLRLFGPSGEPQALETRFGARGDKLGRGRPTALAAPPGRGAEGGEGRAARGSHRLPALAIRPLLGGDPETATATIGALVWAEEGTVWFQPLDRRGTSRGAALPLNANGPLANGAPRLAAGSDGAFLCLWPSARAIQARTLVDAGAPDVPMKVGMATAGEGEPLELLADPEGGFWMPLRTRSGLCVRHLATTGQPDTDDVQVPGDRAAGLDVATIERGLVLLVQPPQGVPVLLLMDREGGILERAPVPIAAVSGPMLPGARVESDGESLLVAWSEERRGASDVYYRVFAADLAGGEVRRWNSDERSSDQLHPDVDARGGGLGVTAWADGRSGTTRIRARVLLANGAARGGEIELPVPFAPEDDLLPEDFAIRPAAALGVDHGFLVAWVASVAGRGEARLQAFDPHGKPRGPARRVDTDGMSSGLLDALALEDGRFVVAFGRPDGGMHVRSFDQGGKELTPPTRVSAHPVADRPALAVLDRGRVAVCWDITVPEGNHAVRGRILAPDLDPESDEIEFPLSYTGDDWDPSVARGPDGGFVLAWIAGQGHGRDVFVGFFDRRGKPVGDPLPVTTRLNEQDWPCLIQVAPEEWVVAWEDDISHFDHTYVRRVTRAGLGPIVTLNEREALFNENRGAPRIAPVAGGILAVFSDVRRSRGHDAFYKVIGRDFDRFD